MLTGEPLEPHWLMMRGLLWRDRLVMHVSPAAVRMLDKMPCILASRVSSAPMPGESLIVPAACCLIRSSHSAIPVRMRPAFAFCSEGAGVTSSIPMEKPRLPMKRADSLASLFMHMAATSAEKSVSSTWNRPSLLPSPRTPLPRRPHTKSPLWKHTYPSLGHSTPVPCLCMRFSKVSMFSSSPLSCALGRTSSVNSCLPVHSSWGSTRAGGGRATTSRASPMYATSCPNSSRV
mmetsp:Transcript_15023/g.45367  ORF Transcript_15023/g.45367 Transcript_15023/m.45367 type:complete len:233 (-) Transcript_15023:1679-2377(-)